jgi:hypothetical protein
MTNIDKTIQILSTSSEEDIKKALSKFSNSKRQRIFTKLIGAALGNVPWVGGFLAVLTNLKNDEGQIKSNQLYEQWFHEHSSKMQLLTETLYKIMQRLDEFPEEIDERLESEGYSQLVKKSFRSWDNADTQEKREIVRKLLTNAGASNLVPDDLIRLFLDWINGYHEAHFAVIRIIYQTPGCTRHAIWEELHGEIPREDSLEADLFKLLIRDLSTGGVIRQQRETDYAGNFLKKPQKKSHGKASSTLTSAFDNVDGYVLTELGNHFVHYTMDEVVPRIGG